MTISLSLSRPIGLVDNSSAVFFFILESYKKCRYKYPYNSFLKQGTYEAPTIIVYM